MRYNEIHPNSKSRRLQSYAKRHFSPLGGRLFVDPIISQIGRGNKSSADIYMCIRRGDLRAPAGEHSSPLLCSENILMRTLLMPCFFYSIISVKRYSSCDIGIVKISYMSIAARKSEFRSV